MIMTFGGPVFDSNEEEIANGRFVTKRKQYNGQKVSSNLYYYEFRPV